jgi:hypothetical protein
MRRLPTLCAALASAEPTTPYYCMPNVHYGSKRIAGDGWFLMPTAAESSDPFLAAGLGISTAAICRLARVLENAPRDDVVRADVLAPLEPQFRTEASYVRRMILTCRRGFADPDLFQRGFFLYRIAAASDGFALADRTLDDATATVWGFGDPALRNLVDTVRAAVDEIPRGRKATREELARLDAIIAQNEPWPFSRTRFGALREDRIYLASLVRVLDFVLKTRDLHRGRRRDGALSSVVGRWTRGFLRPPRVRSTPLRPHPAERLIRDQLRTILSP